MEIMITKRLKQIRKRAGMNQKEFAAALGDGCTQATISKYEQGDAEPPIDRLVKIADFGNVSLDWLVGRTEDRGGATPEIDKIGLDNESIRILEDMAGENQKEEGYDLTGPLNTLLHSPHLRKFLVAIVELEFTAIDYTMHLESRGQKIDANNMGKPDNATEDIKEFEFYLEEMIARQYGRFVSVIADPNTVLQVKSEAVVNAARKIADELTERRTTGYFKMVALYEQHKAARKPQPPHKKEGADSGHD